MRLIELLLVRRYTIQDSDLQAYQPLVSLAQTAEAGYPQRLFSHRLKITNLVEAMNDTYRRTHELHP